MYQLWYENNLLQIKQLGGPTTRNQKGGQRGSQRGTLRSQYTVKIAICLAINDLCQNKQLVLGQIQVRTNDNYETIINKINRVLQKYHLQKVGDFHYIQEDGDIAYVNQELVNRTDLYDAIKYNTTFYVYFESQ